MVNQKGCQKRFLEQLFFRFPKGSNVASCLERLKGVERSEGSKGSNLHKESKVIKCFEGHKGVQSV